MKLLFLGMLVWIRAVHAAVCLDVCTCEPVTYKTLNRTLDTVDCSQISAQLRGRILFNETYGANLAVILRQNDIYNTRQVEGLISVDRLIYLDISRNNLRRFSNVVVKGKALRALYLDSNGFDYISSLSDYGFFTLDILSLTDNIIESIQNKAFIGLETLKVLNISNNRLSEIESQWFHGLLELRELDLSDNVISVIAPDGLNPLTSLTSLNLRGNTLHEIQDNLFVRNVALKFLRIDWNHLKDVPSTALSRLPGVYVIDLSGNRFERFLAGCFRSVQATTLRLNDLSRLTMVDNGAFRNMPKLRTLELHDNHRLMYIAPYSIVRCPKLRTLLFQNNKLSAFPSEPLDLLKNLRILGIYGNPLQCDCNAHWILRDISTNHRVRLLQMDNTLCGSPKELLHVPLSKLDVRDNKGNCYPRILDLFPAKATVFVNDTFSADCRVNGIPIANISWTTPRGLRIKTSSHRNGTAVTSSGTIIVSRVQRGHDGKFTCTAVNSDGVDQRTLILRVREADARILIQHIRDDSIQFTWKGISRQEQYRVVCHRLSHMNMTVAAPVIIQPYWRSYTFQNLRPNTEYQLCISMHHLGHYHRERCMIATTQTNNYAVTGVFSIKKYVVAVAGTGLLLLIVVVVSCAVLYHRRYGQRKRLKEMYGDNMSQLFLSSVSSFNDVTTPVTYENTAATYDDVTEDEESPELEVLTGCDDV